MLTAIALMIVSVAFVAMCLHSIKLHDELYASQNRVDDLSYQVYQRDELRTWREYDVERLQQENTKLKQAQADDQDTIQAYADAKDMLLDELTVLRQANEAWMTMRELGL